MQTLSTALCPNSLYGLSVTELQKMSMDHEFADQPTCSPLRAIGWSATVAQIPGDNRCGCAGGALYSHTDFKCDSMTALKKKLSWRVWALEGVGVLRNLLQDVMCNMLLKVEIAFNQIYNCIAVLMLCVVVFCLYYIIAALLVWHITHYRNMFVIRFRAM